MNKKSIEAKVRAPKVVPPRAPSRSVMTPLARTLRERPRRRATPLDAFALARRKWFAGERIDIGVLASELGVGRATLFRWVGSRELLYGEILSAEYARMLGRVRHTLAATGADLVAEITRHTLHLLLDAGPLRRFIEQDPEFALRVLTSKSSPVQARTVELQTEILRELVAAGEIRPQLDIDTLGFIIVRIGESFLYGEVISGREPDIDKAAEAVRILVAAEAPKRKSTR
jgi:AcrR family transcriptional regulator